MYVFDAQRVAPSDEVVEVLAIVFQCPRGSIAGLAVGEEGLRRDGHIAILKIKSLAVACVSG